MRVYYRDEGECWICEGVCDPDDFEVDHLVPRHASWVIADVYGDEFAIDDDVNLAPVHAKCHKRRPLWMSKDYPEADVNAAIEQIAENRGMALLESLFA